MSNIQECSANASIACPLGVAPNTRGFSPEPLGCGQPSIRRCILRHLSVALAKLTAGDSALYRLYQFGRSEGLMEQLQIVIGGKCHALVAPRNHHEGEPEKLGKNGQVRTRFAGH